MPAVVPLAERSEQRKPWMSEALKLAVAGAAFALLLGFLVYRESRGLPSVEEIRRDFLSKRIPQRHTHRTPLSAISPKLRAAVIVGEDSSFYRHNGFDYDELWDSFLTDVALRRFRRGGSTITQQVAKNVYLGPEKTLSRKFREAILTWRLERVLTKDQILELYLNVADWGDDIVGAESAAYFYFSKLPADLTWSESALLAAMLSNPHRLNPHTEPQQLRRLREVVLLKLLLTHDITPAEYDEARSAPLLPGVSLPVRASAVREEPAF